MNSSAVNGISVTKKCCFPNGQTLVDDRFRLLFKENFVQFKMPGLQVLETELTFRCDEETDEFPPANM